MPASGTAMEVFLSQAVPNTGASEPSLEANTNVTNTPPATGLITVPNTPLNTPTTNTGRTTTATQAFLSRMPIS
jgi:hypothetical protein